jgi:hypothetical protein
MWNGESSHFFPISNGVKQGAIISPILFCVYIDTLLIRLQKNGAGCHIGNLFAAALAYADDVVLIAPTARAMRSMLTICEKFANEFKVTFNAKKTKCITFQFNKTTTNRSLSKEIPPPVFSIDGNNIESVTSWPHLGHLLHAELLDDDDIEARRKKFVGQYNNFEYQFSKVDVSVKNALFKTYCSSHYGAELWNLSNNNIERYCTAWRKAIRKLWKMPRDCSCLNVSAVSNSLPLFDELCRRVMNFISLCLNCDSEFVRSITSYGIASGMFSPIGQNSLICATRYRMRVSQISASKSSTRNHKELCFKEIDCQLLDRANVLREILLVKDGTLTLSNHEFNMTDVDEMIQSLAD